MPRRYALSDSESEDEHLVTSDPSEKDMEQALRDAVGGTYRAGNMEDLTVKRMRMAAENRLGLEGGFFKRDPEWKGRSDWIIKDEVVSTAPSLTRPILQHGWVSNYTQEVQDRLDLEGRGKEEEKPPVKAKPAKAKPAETAKPAKPTKRSNAENASKARKRRKTSHSESEEQVSAGEESEEVRKPVAKQAKAPSSKGQRKPPKRRVSDDSDFEEDASASEGSDIRPAKGSRAGSKKAQPKPSKDRVSEGPNFEDTSESEESEKVTKSARKSKTPPEKAQRKVPEDYVPDDSGSEVEARRKETPKNAGAKLSNDRITDDSDAANEETKPSEAGKDGSESEMSVVLDEAPPKPNRKQQSVEPSEKRKKGRGKDAELDPDQAEIKRLQGWLVKCGIRKMWARELAPYGTPKTKIKHLKGMLKDVGMEGRYSVEKASRIREERELQADLEMVQEGARRWGRGGDEESDGERPRRRLARGRKSLAFLEDMGDGGEETD